MRLRYTLLGTGSSGGVPRGDGDWGACDPEQPLNQRRRCSMLVERLPEDGQGEATTVLVDTSPDLREQMLMAKVRRIDAVLYTHDHADQTHGIDDLRVFAMRQRGRIPCYMDEATHAALAGRFSYIFESVQGYPAICEARAVPTGAFEINGPSGPIPVTGFDQAHGPVRALGYRIGDLAYSPDVSDIPDASFEIIKGASVWVVDALRYKPHPTHAHLDQTLQWIARARVDRAWLTNLHIDMDYDTLTRLLPAHVSAGHDGLQITLDHTDRPVA